MKNIKEYNKLLNEKYNVQTRTKVEPKMFEMNGDFENDLYYEIIDKLEVDHSDAEGLVMAKQKEVEKYYKKGKTPSEIVKVLWLSEGTHNDDMYYKEIAEMSGLRLSAIQNFAKEHKLDAMDFMQQVGQKKIDKKDLVSAIAGGNNNKYSKDIVKKVKQTNESLGESVKYTDQTGAKSALFKDTEFVNLFGPKEHKFIVGAKMFKSSTAIVFTDGKQAIVMSKNKPYSIIKKLGKAPKEIANLVFKESMYEHAPGDTGVINIDKECMDKLHKHGECEVKLGGATYKLKFDTAAE